jgi:hypothetical protein
MSLTRGNATLRKIHDDGAKCKCRNEGDKWWLQAPSFFSIIFRIYNVFRYNNPILHFDTAIQSQCICSHAHTIQIGWSRVAPACREHFRGEFRSKSLQVFTTSHDATRSHDQSAPPRDQSSLSTSSQISSIKQRNIVSIMSRAICRSMLSVGIRPAPKTGSQSVCGRSLWLGLRNHRAARRSIRNQIYIFGCPMTPSSTGLGFGTTPSITKGSTKFRLAALRAARSLRMASWREGSLENSTKKRFAASLQRW